MIEFINHAQMECHQTVGELLERLYGESADPALNAPVFRLRRGTLTIMVAVSAWGEDGAVVEFGTWVAIGPTPSEELYRFLLQRSFEQRFGAFCVDEVGDVQFAYRMPSRLLDKESLAAAIEGVNWTAGRFEGEILNRFGGQRQCDAIAARAFDRALDEAGLRPSEEQ